MCRRCDDESLALFDILDNDFFGGDSADSDSDEDSDLEPYVRVCGDEDSHTGGSVDENVFFRGDTLKYCIILLLLRNSSDVVSPIVLNLLQRSERAQIWSA